jgi:hypothetical protein
MGGGTADLDSLSAYVKYAACQTRAKAKADPNYVGALKLVPPQACAGAV